MSLRSMGMLAPLTVLASFFVGEAFGRIVVSNCGTGTCAGGAQVFSSGLHCQSIGCYGGTICTYYVRTWQDPQGIKKRHMTCECNGAYEVTCCTAKEDDHEEGDPPHWVIDNVYCQDIEGCGTGYGCFGQTDHTCKCELIGG